MKIRFLGTAAAEGIPAVFCNCNACVNAKKLKGKDIRTRSQILVDDDLMLDFPMDSYFHMVQFDLDLSKIENVFITHAHMDHCYPMDFTLHGEPYAYKMSSPRLNIFANQTVIYRVKEQHKTEIKDNVRETLTYNILKSYETVTLKDKKVTALPASHTVGEDCLIYLIHKDGKNFLQFNDSGILNDDVYAFLAKNNVKLDIVSFDCTYGYFEKGKGRHMGIIDNLNERARMEKHGLLKPDTKFVLTHFSHNSNMTFAETVKKVEGLNLIVAYDGMEITSV